MDIGVNGYVRATVHTNIHHINSNKWSSH